MRHINMIRLAGLAVLAAAVAAAPAAAEEWDLSGVDTLQLKGVSGDIIIRQGSPALVLDQDITRGRFHAEVDLGSSTATAEEVWGPGSSSGKVEWTIYVSGGRPALEIKTASGDLDARDVDLQIEFKTASGDVRLDGVDLAADSRLKSASGDFILEHIRVRRDVSFSTASGNVELDGVDVDDDVSFSTASGDVKARRVTGNFSLKSASGDVELRDSTLHERGEFKSASGDVRVSLDQAPSDGLVAASASGDVTLDADSLGGSYTLILIAEKKRGEIDTPFAYTSETTFRRHDRDYMEKRVESGSGGPEIELRTSSGKVTVR